MALPRGRDYELWKAIATSGERRTRYFVWAAADPKIGAVRRIDDIRPEGAMFNHRFETRGGVLEQRAAELLREFFGERRGGTEPESSTGDRT